MLLIFRNFRVTNKRYNITVWTQFWQRCRGKLEESTTATYSPSPFNAYKSWKILPFNFIRFFPCKVFIYRKKLSYKKCTREWTLFLMDNSYILSLIVIFKIIRNVLDCICLAFRNFTIKHENNKKISAEKCIANRWTQANTKKCIDLSCKYFVNVVSFWTIYT